MVKVKGIFKAKVKSTLLVLIARIFKCGVEIDVDIKECFELKKRRLKEQKVVTLQNHAFDLEEVGFYDVLMDFEATIVYDGVFIEV